MSYYFSLKQINIPVFYFIYHDYLRENDKSSDLVLSTYRSSFHKVFTDRDMALKFGCDSKTLVKAGIMMPVIEDFSPYTKVETSVLIPLRKHHMKGADIAKEAIILIHNERPDIKITTFGNLPIDECPVVSSNEGVVSDERLIQLYKENQIVVIPSRVDGIPGPAVEAMINKCTVICSNVSGAKEIIDNGKNGIIVPIEDAHAIKESVLSLIDKPDILEKMGDLARDSIIERFTPSSMVQSFLSVVEYYEGQVQDNHKNAI